MAVGVPVTVLVFDGEGEGVAEKVLVRDAVEVGVWLAVSVGVTTAVGLDVAVGVSVAVGVAVELADGVAEGERVRVGVGMV